MILTEILNAHSVIPNAVHAARTWQMCLASE